MQTDPNAAGAAWVSGLTNAVPKMKQGVQNVKIAPGTLAARNKSGYVSGVQNNADKWAQRTQAVSLTDWQNAWMTKGADRVASGASAAQPRMVAFLTAFLPAVANAVNALPPRGTYEQNKARAIALMDALHGWSYAGAR